MKTRLRNRVSAYIRGRPWSAGLAAVTGFMVGLATGIPLSRGHFGALLVIALSSVILGALVRVMVPPGQRGSVGKLLLIGMGIRWILAAVTYFGSEAVGRAALVSSVPLFYVVGDDATYAEVSWGVVQWYRGQPDLRFNPPDWGGDSYLLGSFTYLEMLVFLIFGPTLLNMQLVNSALAGATIVLLYDAARRIWGPRPAIVSAGLMSFFPSLVLWSVLNLKDALAGLLIVTVAWLWIRFQESARWPLLIAIFAAAIPIETIRRYVYVGLAGLFPIAVALTPRIALRRRAVLTAAASALGLVLVSLGTGAGQGTYGVPTGLDAFEAIRTAMGEGARTTYAEPRAVIAREGQSFVVVDAEALQREVDAAAAATPTPLPTPTPVPTPTPFAATPPPPTTPPRPEPTQPPRVVVVNPGGRVVLASGSPAARPPRPPAPEPPRDVVVVYPGDVVVVSSTSKTPVPGTSQEPLYLRPNLELANTAQLIVTDQPPEALTITRTIAYLPRGLAYAVFAPFPWDIRRALDIVTIPEMLIWYVVLAAIPWSFFRARTMWPYLIPPLLYVAGMMLVFTLTEGNFGTLYRHRAMVTPIALVLAAPGVLAAFERIRMWSRRPRGTA